MITPRRRFAFLGSLFSGSVSFAAAGVGPALFALPLSL
jgi:hypothetical protein